MNCKECTEVLEAYFDQELDPKTGAAVSKHLATCMICRSELNSLNSETALYREYDSDVEVPARLWTEIQARVAVDERPGLMASLGRLFSAPRFSLPATAALVIAAIVVTVAVMHRANRRETIAVNNSAPVENSKPVASKIREEPVAASPEKEKSSRKVSSPKNSIVAAIRSPDQLVRDAEKKYLAAITILSRDVAQRRSQLDPETRLKLEQALSSIDRTIAATRRAVRQNPNDPVAAQYMLGAYARKVDALREMAGGGL